MASQPANQLGKVICHVCKQEIPRGEALPAEMVRLGISEAIRKTHPDWSAGKFICAKDLNHFRAAYVEHVLAEERGELTALEDEVIQSFRQQELLSKDVDSQFERALKFGERAADKMADFGGSWRFLGIFAALLLVWIVVNLHILVGRPFDPYPFILLNLVLSCLAAIQAPVIMMSQNRQEAKDRLRGQNDYLVNLKAELEIRHVNAKLDLLLTHQWQRLMEIQQIQMDLMEEIAGEGPHGNQAQRHQ